MARLIAVLAGVLVSLLGIAAPADAAPGADQDYVTANAYDVHHTSGGSSHTICQRGPPTASRHYVECDAVKRWSRGASARPDGVTPRATYDYDHTAPVVQAVSVAATTEGRAGVTTGPVSPLTQGAAAANNGRVAAQACRTNSFTGDTLVLMADGTKKPIKDIKLGDKVMATDPETGETGPRKVVDLIRHGGLHTMVAVRLADGSTIDVTDRHPFWVENRGEWVDAIDLEPGDVVVTADGERLTVASMSISEQDLTAYNLTVEGLHTYHVGMDEILVHNTGCTNIADLPVGAVRNLTEDSGFAFSRLSQNHGVTRIEFREQIHMIKRNENLPADFNLSFGPTGDVWNPRTGELIGRIVHGG